MCLKKVEKWVKNRQIFGQQDQFMQGSKVEGEFWTFSAQKLQLCLEVESFGTTYSLLYKVLSDS